MTIIISPFPIYFNEPSQFGLPQGLSGKESACNVGDTDSIPGPPTHHPPPTPIACGFSLAGNPFCLAWLQGKSYLERP